jgi:hypothetical protein
MLHFPRENAYLEKNVVKPHKNGTEKQGFEFPFGTKNLKNPQ